MSNDGVGVPAPEETNPVADHGMLDDGEFQALGRIAAAMLQYGSYATSELARWHANYVALSEEHKSLLAHLPRKLSVARHAVRQNAAVLREIVADGERTGVVGPAMHAAVAYAQATPEVAPLDVSKVRYVLKNLMRDWSAEGARERAPSCDWLVDAACRYLPPPSDHDRPSLLVPGSGLGRLPAELAGRGFRAVGNEFSYYMLLTSSFVLNSMSHRESIPIHPWVLSTSNQRTDGDQLRAVRLPDKTTSEMLGDRGGELNMIAGDFVAVFSDPDQEATFDGVVTSFFIDTAHNIVEYLETIYSILKPGGYWFNVGPLLYHWAATDSSANGSEASLELSLEDVKAICAQVGFMFVEEDECTAVYLGNERALVETTYTAARWTARKPMGPDGSS